MRSLQIMNSKNLLEKDSMILHTWKFFLKGSWYALANTSVREILHSRNLFLFVKQHLSIDLLFHIMLINLSTN